MILPLVLLAGKLVAGAIAGAAIAAAVVMICFDDVLRNLRRHKVHAKDLGDLVATHLKNGNVKVVASVLSNRPLGIFPRHVRHEEIFEGKMDSQLENLFGDKKKVTVKL